LINVIYRPMVVDRVGNCESFFAVIQVAVGKFELFSNLSKDPVVNGFFVVHSLQQTRHYPQSWLM